VAGPYSISHWVAVTDPFFEPLAAMVRDGLVESVHRGAIALVDRQGRLTGGAGDPDLPLILRSAAKPFQALALVASGAVEALSITQKELAVMCGSHAGRAEHVAVVEGLLSRLGVTPDSLTCGPLTHMCSGKHTGMIALALHLGAPVEGYEGESHPVQKAIEKVIRDLLEAGPDSAGVAGRNQTGLFQREPGESLLATIDGCGVPNVRVSFREAAYLFALLAAGADASLRQIRDAMLAFPEMIAGEGRFDTTLMQAGGGRILAKAGAEGIFAVGLQSVALPGGLGEGPLGCVVKMADGAPRAIPVVVRTCLEAYGISLSAELFDNARPRTPEGVRGILHQGQAVSVLDAGRLRRPPSSPPGEAGRSGDHDPLAGDKDARLDVGRGDEKDVVRFLRMEWPSADEETFGRPLEWVAEPYALIVRRKRKVTAVLRGHFTGGVASVDELMVGRTERGTGLGSMLLARFEADAEERGARRLVLRAVKDSPAEVFYHNRGYRRECVERAHEFGFDYVRLTRELAAADPTRA
jgi:L-asparaginase II/GNAT superfamily N-acetyltransferase